MSSPQKLGIGHSQYADLSFTPKPFPVYPFSSALPIRETESQPASQLSPEINQTAWNWQHQSRIIHWKDLALFKRQRRGCIFFFVTSPFFFLFEKIFEPIEEFLLCPCAIAIDLRSAPNGDPKASGRQLKLLANQRTSRFSIPACKGESPEFEL